MKESLLHIPVLLLFFNRPEYAREVILAVAKVKPATIYVALDGPREGSLTDQEGIDACIKLLDIIDWSCQIQILKRDDNLGCGLAVSQAISWFFTHETMGIILEDDCVPTSAFFNFCERMLRKYKDDDRIMHVAGTRWHEEFTIDTSYFFTSIGHIWGWATWRRAWKLYDYNMENWPTIRQTNLLKTLFEKKKHIWYWQSSFDKVYYAIYKHTWDYQWQYALFVNSGLAVTPHDNLVQNIGINGVHDSRFESHKHKRSASADFSVAETQIAVRRETEFDMYNMNHHFLHKGPLWLRIKTRLQIIYKASAH